MGAEDPFEGLNPGQRAAVMAEPGRPLLILAGAGTGKTHTLAHRLAWLLAGGADPRRVMLLTFTRRAALELTRRAQRIATRVLGKAGSAELPWSGTFHAVANRLLRLHGDAIGLDGSFTVLDRSDSADLIDLVRQRLGLAAKARRFPRKATCAGTYSRAVNTRGDLRATLEAAFPWCKEWEDELRTLFGAYVEAKQARRVLDYDDLLLYWFHLMQEPGPAALVRAGFDHVLVDEYQDTNALQEAILLGLRPDGSGLTAVGDDAQAIFGFRAATVENILGFPSRFTPPAAVVALTRSYRAHQAILDLANAALALSPRAARKPLVSDLPAGPRPSLVATEDEATQADYVVERVLAAREEGVELKRQAVLFRTAHHSAPLEVELARRGIPFVKFGGLRFLEAAHVKDVLCVLRWAENPRDATAGFRVLQLLPGVGPAKAARVQEAVDAAGGDLGALAAMAPPAGAAGAWPDLVGLMQGLRAAPEWAGQLERVRRWYQPHLERLHDDAGVRQGDLEQMEAIGAQFPSRASFLVELTLDPPEATGAEAGPPRLDEDYLILSTIHSAKGQEWDQVLVINVVDGCIPSDMATGTAEEIEEERRLLYVAMTRARRSLHLIHPVRFLVRQQARLGDRHLYAPLSRFLPDPVKALCERVSHGRPRSPDPLPGGPPAAPVDVGARLRAMWRG